MVKYSTCIVWTLGTLTMSMWTMYIKFDSLLEMAIRSQFVLEEGNDLWKNWINVPVGLLGYKYYFFEVLNPSDVLRGSRVKVREHGPYCFTHRRYKRITGWGPNNETVKYMEYKVNYFDPDCSGSNSLDDTFTMINPLFASLGQAISDLVGGQLPLAPLTSPLVYSMLNTFLDAHGQSLFMTKSVREVIYGFKVNLLETMETLTTPLRNMGITLDALPPSPPNNMFGLLYGRNDTPEGEYEVYTGKGSTAKLIGQFKTVKGSPSTSWWKGEYCNEIRGGDGSLFAPFTSPNTRLSAFALDICRSIDFAYKGDGEYKGIKGYRFGLPNEAFMNPKSYPPNECFCIHKSKRARCDTYNGVYDLGGCQAGAPLVLSLPHYLDVYPVPEVDGLAPNRKIHDTYVILEPITSAPIYGSKKLMFSLRVERVPFLRNFQSIKPGLIPFVWAEEAGGLTDELAVQFREIVDILTSASSYVLLVAFVTTLIFLIALCLVMLCGGSKSKKKVSPVKDSSNGLTVIDSPVKINTANTSVETTPVVESNGHAITDQVINHSSKAMAYPSLMTPNVISSNFTHSAIPTPPNYPPPPPPPPLSSQGQFSGSSYTGNWVPNIQQQQPEPLNCSSLPPGGGTIDTSDNSYKQSHVESDHLTGMAHGGIGRGEEGMQLTRSPRQLTQEAIEQAQEHILQEQNSQHSTQQQQDESNSQVNEQKDTFSSLPLSSFNDQILFMNSHLTNLILPNETSFPQINQEVDQSKGHTDIQPDQVNEATTGESQSEIKSNNKVTDESKNDSNGSYLKPEEPYTPVSRLSLSEMALEDSHSYEMYVNLLTMNGLSRESIDSVTREGGSLINQAKNSN